MATGFAPYLLKDVMTLQGANYTGLKLDPAGFTGMLLENSNVVEAKLNSPQGHKKTAKVKYKVRQDITTVATEDNCDIDFTPVYKEADLETVNFVKTGFHLSMETVAKYQEEASKQVAIGASGKPVLNELANSIAHTANALIQKTNSLLLAQTTWGINVVSGLNTATTVNIPLTPSLNLSTGLSKIMGDAFESGFNGDLLIVGNGIFNNYEMTKSRIGLNSAGLDQAVMSGYKFYADWLSKSVWGANQIGVFEKGSIHLVDFQKYVGFQAGQLGNSWFDQIDLNVNVNGVLVPITFDIQIKELDCPTSLLDGYGNAGTYDRGYGVYITKTTGLFQTPSDAFSAGDALSGVNGALRYTVTNA